MMEQLNVLGVQVQILVENSFVLIMMQHSQHIRAATIWTHYAQLVELDVLIIHLVVRIHLNQFVMLPVQLKIQRDANGIL